MQIILYLIINNKVLLYSTGNYIQYPVINLYGKEHIYMCVCVCITESLCCISYTSMKFKKKKHSFSSVLFSTCLIFNSSHSNRCEVRPHSGFDLQFPDD